jgi:hypothetical protein
MEETHIVRETQIVPEIHFATVEVTHIVHETVVVIPVPVSPPTVMIQPAPTSELVVDEQTRIEVQPPRAQHTATLISDGRVLLVGGNTSPSEQLAEVEIFDPVSGNITQAAPLHTPRHGHTATLLPDGRVIVIGGANQQKGWLDDAEIYDPSTDVWTVIPMLSSHGIEHTATLMIDGRVLVVGGAVGSGEQTDRVDIFDPQSDTWFGAMPLESDRASHTAQLLEDGRVLVAGGGSVRGFPAGGDALIYDPQLNSWTQTGAMVNMRISGKSVRLSDGRVLVVGGINLADTFGENPTRYPLTSAEIYDPNTNIWTATGDLSQARVGHVLTLLQDNRVMVSGGARDWDCCWSYDSYAGEIEVYDPGAGLWYPINELPNPGVYSAGVLLADGRILISGGETGEYGTTFLSDLWFYTP